VPSAILTRRGHSVADREMRSVRLVAMPGRVTLDTARSGNNGPARPLTKLEGVLAVSSQDGEPTGAMGWAQPAVMSPLPEELRSTWAGFPV